MDSVSNFACSLIKVIVRENIVAITTPVFVAMVMHSWKNMDYIVLFY